MEMKNIDPNYSDNVLESTVISMSFLILKFYENKAQVQTLHLPVLCTNNN